MIEEKKYNKCENCGAPVDNNSRSCPYCQSQYPKIKEEQIDINAPVTITDSIPDKKVKGLNPVLAIFLMILLAPVGIAYVVGCIVINFISNYPKRH